MQLFQEKYTATAYAGTQSLFLVLTVKLNVYRYNTLIKKKRLKTFQSLKEL